VALARGLALLAELVRADAEHSAALRELDELVDGTRAVRARADELASIAASVPAERERLSAALAGAEADAGARAAALAEAERELAAAEAKADRERLAAARRFHVRAQDALRMAERRSAQARSEREAFEERVAAALREAPEVEARAAALAAALRGRPRGADEAGRPPDPGLDGVARWASAARAALVVARSGVATEREAVIRQANELASMLLGEPLAAASAADVARRVERALR
jgi:chromosome segregation ATPase